MIEKTSDFPRRQFLAAGASTLLAAVTSSAAQNAANAAPPQSNATLKIQRLAWAGIKMECGDTALFVDAHTDPSYGAANVPLATSAGSRSAVVTHHHGDHCDPAALKEVLGANGRLICHRQVAPWFDPKGIQLQTVDTHEPVFFSRGSADLVARAVPAVDGLGHPQFSWVIDGGGKRIIHCGDTLWHGYWYDIASAYGPFDAAFLPINGFRQSAGRYVDSGIPMSLTPEQAVAAAIILKARLVVPIHYGATGMKDYVEVPEPEANFRRLAATKAVPVKIVGFGDILEL